MFKHDVLLIGSSSPERRRDLREIFQDTYHLLEAADIRQLLFLLRQNLDCIAALLLDISDLSRADVELIHQEENRQLLSRFPVIILSEDDSTDMLNRAFDFGAADVLPVDYASYAMLRRVSNIIELHLRKQNLEDMVNEQKSLLRNTSDTMVDALSAIIEFRSVESGQHIRRIRLFAQVLLEEVARCCPEYQLNQERISIICSASALHDIGKIAIPDAILMKPGPLTEEEWEIMKTHSLTGCQILDTLGDMTDREYLRYARNICHYHHERWDGNGYPEGLQGESIPICAQVVGLVDAYDAMTSRRVYKDAVPCSEAVNRILLGECGVFSPKLLECFKHIVRDLEALAKACADGIPTRQESSDLLPQAPEPAEQDTVEYIRGKYYALVHYINGFLIELDLDRQMFHLVYNPFPELSLISETSTPAQIGSLVLKKFIHPSDKERMAEFLRQGIPQFLEEGLRRSTHYFRAISQEDPNGVEFELTMMRINPLNSQRRTLAILARRAAARTPHIEDNRWIYAPMDATYCCRNDAYFTLVRPGALTRTLAGYTEADIHNRFDGKLLLVAHPDDREMIRREFSEQLKHGPTVSLEHRVLHKNGSSYWVYNKSRLVTDDSGNEIIYSFLIDIQNVRRNDNLVQEKLRRYEIILAQTENVLFEWDVIQDTISVSDTWEKIFGYYPGPGQRGWVKRWLAYVHPDDGLLLMDAFSRLEKGSPYEMIEVRMVTTQKRYLWCRIRATAIRDPRGTMEKICGIIINFDDEKREEQALLSRADTDSLTRLLNKNAARKQAEQYFSRLPGGASGSLLIIDLDNFKQINDRYGHLFGDTVLIHAAREIKKLFREQDIVARIGGDEFLVLVRGIADTLLLEQRCRQLIRLLSDSLRSQQPQLELSCSIGVAVAPAHGKTYLELYQHADQALYQAKARGKNCFFIYNPEDAAEPGIQSCRNQARKPIDSDSEPGMANDTLVRYAFRKLYTSQDIDRSIHELLAYIGEKIHASRVYIFENSEDNRFCRNTYEWCSQGISPQIESLQHVSYETDIPNYSDYFDEQGIFYCPDVALLPKNIYDIVAPQGIKAMLHCAMRENGIFRGYIGFDDCSEPRMWTKDQIELLRFFSESMSVFLMRQRRQEKVQRQVEELRFILDSQNAWSYVVDPETLELLYINSQIRENGLQMRPGSLCYRLLENRDTPCGNCPLKKIADKKNYTCLHRKGQTDMLLEATRIRWNDKQAVLISGHRLPEA